MGVELTEMGSQLRYKLMKAYAKSYVPWATLHLLLSFMFIKFHSKRWKSYFGTLCVSMSIYTQYSKAQNNGCGSGDLQALPIIP